METLSNKTRYNIKPIVSSSRGIKLYTNENVREMSKAAWVGKCFPNSQKLNH